jgi:hypothetical protein
VQLAVWYVREGSPARVVPGNVRLERELEDWIADDPSLAVEGLEVVGRQIGLEGGRLDLLGVDPQGLLTVVEIKRGRLYRDTVAQALDYASSVSAMPTARLSALVRAYAGEDAVSRSPVAEALEADGERRDVRVVVVGTGRDASLDRIVHYLGDNYDVPIQVVTFEVFPLEPEGQVLVREVTEAEPSTLEGAAPATRYSIDNVFALARQHGTTEMFQAIHDFALHKGLYAHPWKWSIMYTPSGARHRTLFTVWTKPTGELRIYTAPASTFAEFFPVTEEQDREPSPVAEWEVVRGRDGAESYTARLEQLLPTPEQVG